MVSNWCYILAIPIGQVIPLVFMAIGVVLLLYASTRRLVGKAGLSQEEAARKIPQLREHLEVKERLEKLLIELQELAREINAHIDTRFCKLQVLMEEADKKIQKLEALNSSIKTPSEKTESSDDEYENVDPEHKVIYQLADKGMSAVDIAKQVNKTVGEVELVLSLRKTKREANNKPRIDYRIED